MSEKRGIKYAECVMCGGEFRLYHERNRTCSKMCEEQRANANRNEKWAEGKKRHKNMASSVKWGRQVDRRLGKYEC